MDELESLKRSNLLKSQAISLLIDEVERLKFERGRQFKSERFSEPERFKDQAIKISQLP